MTLSRGDVLTADLPEAGFDLVTAVASLHHLPLRAGPARLAALVRPGGALTVVGLRRADTATDYLTSACAFPMAGVLRWRRGHTPVGALVRDPADTLDDVHAAARARARRPRPAAPGVPLLLDLDPPRPSRAAASVADRL